jgi:transposase InsO family protein
VLRRPVESAQYCAHTYQELVKQFGMLASMSRKGNCYDNAPMESFWGSLKNELIHHQRYATRALAMCRPCYLLNNSAGSNRQLETRVSAIDSTPHTTDAKN